MDAVFKPVFQKTPDEALFLQIKKKVLSKVRELRPRRQLQITFKALLFPSVYMGVYVTALLYATHKVVYYGGYFVMGILLVVIFLNQIHDAVHGTLWKRRWLNEAYVYFFDLMGANSYVWKVRHTRLHHNYPNVVGWDSDIEQSSLARLFPSGPFSRLHRYQHIYLPMLYIFYLLNWLVVRDFKDYFNRSKPVWKVVQIPRREFLKLFVFKAFFFGYVLVLPLMMGVVWEQAAGAFLVMVFTASIFSLLVLLPPHANIENSFSFPDVDNRLPYPWFVHQLKHTNDVTHDNWFTRFFMGCFNYHVAHHLFPSVNHVYYPEVTAILKEALQESGLPYKSYPLGRALLNHYRLLKRNGVVENVFEETM